MLRQSQDDIQHSDILGIIDKYFVLSRVMHHF